MCQLRSSREQIAEGDFAKGLLRLMAACTLLIMNYDRSRFRYAISALQNSNVFREVFDNVRPSRGRACSCRYFLDSTWSPFIRTLVLLRTTAVEVCSLTRITCVSPTSFLGK